LSECGRMGETINAWKHVMLRDDAWLELAEHSGRA